MLKTLYLLFVSALVLQLNAAEKWLTDMSAAKQQAEKENKVILVDFTGSTWCPPCKALKKNVFDKKEFAEFAKKNLVLLEVDFPRDASKAPAPNRRLAEQFDIESFPTIILLDKNGKVLGRFDDGYGGESVTSYIKKLEKHIAAAKS